MTPADQAKLTPEALDEDETVILRANDPNAPDNVVLFSYELMEYHKVPVNAAQFHLTTHLDKSLGEIHHRESNDAKAQLAMQTQIAEKEKAVLEDIIKQGVYAEGETCECCASLLLARLKKPTHACNPIAEELSCGPSRTRSCLAPGPQAPSPAP